MKKNIKYLIFDFDGVLGDTFSVRNKVLQELSEKSLDEVINTGDQYMTKSPHTRDAKLSSTEIDRFEKEVTAFGLLLQKYSFPMFEAFIDEIGKINNTKLAVVSSGSPIYILPSLENIKLKFTHILTFNDHHSKEEKVEKICKDWGISTEDAYFFTDSLSDINELENLISKDKLYGCSWGYQGYDSLATKLDRKYILKTFNDIHEIFKD